MPSSEENLTLLWMIMQQKLDSGLLTGIDWASIAVKLGLEKPAAASLRWTRLKKELSENNGVPKASGDGTGTPTKAKKPATPRKKKEPAENGEEKPAPKKRTPKKRKIEEVAKEMDVDGNGSGSEIKSEEESGEAEQEE
jgi:hypothetical protein